LLLIVNLVHLGSARLQHEIITDDTCEEKIALVVAFSRSFSGTCFVKSC